MPSVLLTDALLRSIKPGEKLIEYWDTRVSGLCLRISPGGVRTWTFRYRPKDSTSFKRLSLGRYPEVGLSLARQRAQEKRVEVAGGADPQGERKAKRAASALTFDSLADDYLERYAKPRKRSWANDALYLRAHVRPTWGPRPATRISRADAESLPPLSTSHWECSRAFSYLLNFRYEDASTLRAGMESPLRAITIASASAARA